MLFNYDKLLSFDFIVFHFFYLAAASPLYFSLSAEQPVPLSAK